VDGETFEQVARLDAATLVRAMADAGGPSVELVRLLEGGEVGAWLVAWPDGHHGVLTWLPAASDGRTVDETQALMGLARRAGVPVPTWEVVVGLGPLGTAVLQRFVAGAVPDEVSDALAGALVGLAEKRRGLLVGTTFAGMPMPLYLTAPGPGFCLHEPLRAFGPKTAALLERVHAVGERHGDHLVGDDIVHNDYHPGNVLVDPDRPNVVSWVVDWGAVRPGRVELDLAILAFDLTWRAPGAPQQRVESHLRARTDLATFEMVWAHASLRLLDWTIRHYPHDVDHWTTVAERHLPSL
jgi:hypothetical protein